MRVGLVIGGGDADCMNKRAATMGEDAKGVANLEDVVVVEVIRWHAASVFEAHGGDRAVGPQGVAGDAEEGDVSNL